MLICVFQLTNFDTNAANSFDPKTLKDAAEQGDIRAQVNLGYLYLEGKGVAQDYQQAIYWYTKAAERGNPNAQFNLGVMYGNGRGVPQNYKQAIYWFTKAAEQGNINAQNNLGYMHMYLKDKGFSQDYRQALYWYTKAAERGSSLAQVNLGLLYWKGLGVPKDYIKAYAWSNLSAAQGDETAINNLTAFSSNMTQNQIAKAQELSSAIQQKINNPDQKYYDNNDKSEIRGFGTGFIISKDGYLLTCYHVIDEANSIKVLAGGDSYPARLVRVDANNDIALLKITGSFQALAFSSKTATMGQEVFTIGYPNPLLQGVSAKLTKGEINSLTGVMDDVRLYQISIPVQPGNSGGPLLDMSGNINGLIVSMLNAKTALKISGTLPQNVNYAVKSSYARSLLDTLPEISNMLLPPSAMSSFQEVVSRVTKSIVMIVVY